MKIVGVVGDVRQLGPSRPAPPVLYMPYAQHPMLAPMQQLMVRTSTASRWRFRKLYAAKFASTRRKFR